MHLKAVIVRTWMQSLSEMGDIPSSRNRASLEMHLEAVIERVWRYALGGHENANWEAVIE